MFLLFMGLFYVLIIQILHSHFYHSCIFGGHSGQSGILIEIFEHLRSIEHLHQALTSFFDIDIHQPIVLFIFCSGSSSSSGLSYDNSLNNGLEVFTR